MAPVLEADRKRRAEREKRKAEALAKEQRLEQEHQSRRKSETNEEKPVVDDENEKFYDAAERLASPIGDDELVTTGESMTVNTESFKYSTFSRIYKSFN